MIHLERLAVQKPGADIMLIRVIPANSGHAGPYFCWLRHVSQISKSNSEMEEA